MKFEANGIDGNKVAGWGTVSENVPSRMPVSGGMDGSGAANNFGATNNAVTGVASAPANASTMSVAESPKAGTSAVSGQSAKSPEDAGEKLAAEMKIFNATAAEFRESIKADAPFAERVSRLMTAASDLFGLAPTWTAFYREVLGAEGLMRCAVTAGDEMNAFECSLEHGQLLEMLTALRSRDLPENDPFEQQRMITVRIPKSLHDSICAEANALSVSVNKLCISRMLQKIDPSLIPTSVQKRRGRRPGANSNSQPEAQVIAGKVTATEGSPMFIRTDNASTPSPMRDGKPATDGSAAAGLSSVTREDSRFTPPFRG